MEKSKCKKGDIAFFCNFVSPALVEINSKELKRDKGKGDWIPHMYCSGWAISLIRDDISKLFDLNPYSAFDLNGDIVSSFRDFYRKNDLYLPTSQWISKDNLDIARDYFLKLGLFRS